MTILSATIFALIFILLAFVIPLKKDVSTIDTRQPKGTLEKISHGARDN